MKGIKVGGTGLNNLCYDDDSTPTADTVDCRAQDVNPLKPNSSDYYTLSYSPNLAFLVSDIRALWRLVPSARMPECQKLQTVC